jgi:hypothetical protein
MKLTDQQPADSERQFVKVNTAAHWYGVDLATNLVVPRYEATLREARKEGLYPSPTTIEKDIRANPVLARWIKNETAKAFVENPRNPGESDDGYAARCLDIADRIAREAAKKGVGIHDAIEHEGTTDPVILPFYEAYIPWRDDHIEYTIGQETMLADRRIGVAGRVDKIVQHRQHGRVILDWKTQRVRKKPEFYDSFPRQLSFYAEADKETNGGILPRIMSVVIDSQNPSRPYEKLYTPEEQAAAYKEFLCHSWLWFNERDFWPVGKWSPSFTL